MVLHTLPMESLRVGGADPMLWYAMFKSAHLAVSELQAEVQERGAGDATGAAAGQSRGGAGQSGPVRLNLHYFHHYFRADLAPFSGEEALQIGFAHISNGIATGRGVCYAMFRGAHLAVSRATS